MLPWGRGDARKVRLFLFAASNLRYFSSNAVLEFLCQSPGLPKGSFVSGWLTKSVFFRGSWTMAERSWSHSWAIQGPQLGLRSVWLLPHTEMGETLPESHGYGAGDRTKAKWGVAKSSRVWHCFWVYLWDHDWWVSYLGVGMPSQNGSPQSWTAPGFHNPLLGSPTKHFCPWMDTKLLPLRGKYEWWTSYLAIFLTSHSLNTDLRMLTPKGFVCIFFLFLISK